MQLSRPWQELLGRPLFEQASSAGCAALDKMIAVFVERSHSLFKASAMLCELKPLPA